MTKKVAARVEHLLKSFDKGVTIDLGCTNQKTTGSIGVNKKKYPGVDIVHDLEVVPYPFPDECASVLIAANLVQKIKPWLFIDIMDEWWRLLKPGGQLMISTPYAGSFGFYQDPNNLHGFNEAFVAYFDPLENIYSKGELYKVYEPKPWKIEFNAWSNTGALEVVLSKRKDDKAYHGR